MKKYEFSQFALDHLEQKTVEPPAPGPGEILLEVNALSLNYRDLLVVTGAYNPRLNLPATPVSDGSGVVAAVGEGVTGVQPGDRVMSHFVSGWIDGPFRGEYVGTTLGVPGAGLAAEQVVLPATAVVPVPEGYDHAEASTLPIAALTAWNALVVEGRLQTLGQSLRAARAGGTIAMLGALTGLQGEVNIAPLVMNRLHVAGILVGSREAFMDMVRFIESSGIRPVISDRFAFDRLPEALGHMQGGKHFGKIVVEV